MQRAGQIGDHWLSRNRHGIWCRTWFDRSTSQTRRHSFGTRDFDAALLKLAEWVVLNERLDKASPADVPVPVILKRYYERHARHTPSADMAALAIAKLETFFSDDDISALTLDRQREFEADLQAKGHSDGYVGRIQTVLKAALNRAYRNQELAAAPFVRVLPAGQRTRVLAPVEAAALFNATPPEHLLVYLLVMFNTMARPEAALELQPFQIDLERRLVDTNPPGRRQTRKYRATVPITDTLLPWLQARMKQRYIVQWHDEQSAPLSSLKTTWRRLRNDAERLLREADPGHGGLAGVVPKTIQHTMATELRRRGVPRWEVDGMLGHSTAGTTDIYAKFAPDYLGKAAAAIDDYMNELQPLVKREIILNVTPLHGRGRKA
jgi:integrase